MLERAARQEKWLREIVVELMTDFENLVGLSMMISVKLTT